MADRASTMTKQEKLCAEGPKVIITDLGHKPKADYVLFPKTLTLTTSINEMILIIFKTHLVRVIWI